MHAHTYALPLYAQENTRNASYAPQEIRHKPLSSLVINDHGGPTDSLFVADIVSPKAAVPGPRVDRLDSRGYKPWVGTHRVCETGFLSSSPQRCKRENLRTHPNGWVPICIRSLRTHSIVAPLSPLACLHPMLLPCVSPGLLIIGGHHF